VPHTNIASECAAVKGLPFLSKPERYGNLYSLSLRSPGCETGHLALQV
jgi:hypothetical protein